MITFASCTTTSTVTVQTYTSTPIQPINNSTNTTVNRVLVEKQLASLSLSTTTNESPAAVSGKIKVSTNNNKQPPQINIKQNAENQQNSENSNPQQQHTTHQYAPVPHQATPHTKVTNPQISSNKPKQLNFDNPALNKPPQIMSSTTTTTTNGREARSKVKNANSSQPTATVKQPIATAKPTTTTKKSDHSPEFSSSSESSSTNSSSESLSVTSSYSLASSSNTTTETTNSTNNYPTASMAAPMSVTLANSSNNNFVMPTRVTRNSGKTTTSKETTVCHKLVETAQVACGHNSRVTAATNNQDMVFIPPRTPVRSKTRESQYTTPSKLVSKSG